MRTIHQMEDAQRGILWCAWCKIWLYLRKCLSRCPIKVFMVGNRRALFKTIADPMNHSNWWNSMCGELSRWFTEWFTRVPGVQLFTAPLDHEFTFGKKRAHGIDSCFGWHWWVIVTPLYHRGWKLARLGRLAFDRNWFHYSDAFWDPFPALPGW